AVPTPGETKKAPATRPKPATPPAPTMYTAAAGTHLDMAVTDTISSRTNHAGDVFSARAVADVTDAQRHVVIPAAAATAGTAPAPTSGGRSSAASWARRPGRASPRRRRTPTSCSRRGRTSS